MSDKVDVVVSKYWPKVQAAIQAGLDSEPTGALKTYVSVSSASNAAPYRVARMDWSAIDNWPGLERANPTFEYALRLYSDSPRVRLVDLPDTDLHGVTKWAIDVRNHERDYVLELIGEAANKVHPPRLLTEHNIRQAAQELGGSCRLIATSDSATRCEEYGYVAERVNRPSSLPQHVKGLLVRMDGGPLVTRTVDDLGPTWNRVDEESFCITLSEAFFLDHKEVAWCFR